MKRITLTQGKYALVSDIDFAWLVQYKWRALHSPSGRWYAMRHVGKGRIYMHRMISPYRPEVDHRNMDGLDNRRCNLRRATKQQNRMNRVRYKNNSSGYKGVSWHSVKNCWSAYIGFNGDQKHLGLFKSKCAAARAYDRAARRYFGRFARTNFAK